MSLKLLLSEFCTAIYFNLSICCSVIRLNLLLAFSLVELNYLVHYFFSRLHLFAWRVYEYLNFSHIKLTQPCYIKTNTLPLLDAVSSKEFVIVTGMIQIEHHSCPSLCPFVQKISNKLDDIERSGKNFVCVYVFTTCGLWNSTILKLIEHVCPRLNGFDVC